jgi:hypothetical protein
MARTLVRAETQINNDWSEGSAWFLRADGSTPMEGNLDLGSNKITNLANPTEAGDAANMAYVDSVAQGLDVKRSVRVKYDTNIANLAAFDTTNQIDGVTVVEGDRVLLNGQTDKSENGIYVVGEVVADIAALTRAEDANTSDQVNAGMFMFVNEGDAHADSGWVLVTDGDITLGTTNLDFTKFTGVGQIQAGDGLTKDGNTLSVDLADESLHFVSGQLAVQLKSGGAIGLDSEDGLELLYNSDHFRVESGDLELFHSTADGGEILIAAANGTVSYVAISGDASMAASGAITVEASDDTIVSTGSGIRLVRGTNGQLLVGQTDAQPVYKTISGDATLDEEGVLTITKDFVEEENYIVREVPSGTINGTNDEFALANEPLAGSEMVFLNGVLQMEGEGLDYAIGGANGNVITFEEAPLSGDRILVTYIKADDIV